MSALNLHHAEPWIERRAVRAVEQAVVLAFLLRRAYVLGRYRLGDGIAGARRRVGGRRA